MTQAVKKRKIFDGSYEIISIVGRGACSVVYRAKPLAEPDIEVALKVLVDRNGNKETASNLRREAMAMVAAKHQYVMRLDDFHSLDNLSYLTMEYAPGSDLRTYTKNLESKFPASQAENYLKQIASALAYIHQEGIIHRDIKPSNILIINDNEARLSDFGVAILPGEKNQLEDLEKGVGTMEYMAPEVLEGKASEMPADVYSLALTFYEILSGVHPFENIHLAEILDARKEENLKAPHEINPKVPTHLSLALMKALSYDPNERYQSGEEFYQALNEAVSSNQSREIKPTEEVSAFEDFESILEEEQENETKAENVIQADFKAEEKQEENPEESFDDFFDFEPTKEEEGNEPGPEPKEEEDIFNFGEIEDDKQIQIEEKENESNSFSISHLEQQQDLQEPLEELDPSVGEIQMATSKAKFPIKKIIFAALAFFALMILWNLLFSKKETTDLASKPDNQKVISLDQNIFFPNLPAGQYSGLIDNFLPEKTIPFNIVAYPEQGLLTIFLGLNGWKPAIINLNKLSEKEIKSNSFILRSNGFVLKFQQTEPGKLSGTLTNVLSNQQASWRIFQ